MLVGLPTFYGKLASSTLSTAETSCENVNVADSFGYFIFECNNKELKKLRADPGSRSIQTADQPHRQQQQLQQQQHHQHHC